MRHRYRIVPTTSNLWTIEKRLRYFPFLWRKVIVNSGNTYPISFSTIEQAKKWIGDKMVEHAKIDDHFAHPPIYYP